MLRDAAFVMAGHGRPKDGVPAIHALLSISEVRKRTWMPATSAGMTKPVTGASAA
jgi:hypothetical protein